MPTNTQGTTARQYHTQQMHYLRLDVEAADDGRADLVLGILPAGAQIHQAMSGISVNIIFDGTTDVLGIGTAAAPGLYASALILSGLGFFPNDEVVSNKVDVDTEILVTFTSAVSPTVGQASIIMAYTVDND
jgi:hypothetical protein